MKTSKPKTAKISITIPLNVAETLEGLIDGAIGTADCDEFVSEMKQVLKALEKSFNRRLKKITI
jgi:hypothetical protein